MPMTKEMTPDEKIISQCNTAYNCVSNAYHELLMAGRREDADEIMAAAMVLKRIGNDAFKRRHAVNRNKL